MGKQFEMKGFETRISPTRGIFSETGIPAAQIEVYIEFLPAYNVLSYSEDN